MSITRTTRTTSDPLADIAALAVHELRWACGCIRYTNVNGHISTRIHEGAAGGHQPTGASTNVTRSARSQQKAAAKMDQWYGELQRQLLEGAAALTHT